MQNHILYISLCSLAVSIISLYFTRVNHQSFAKQEFVKKQIHVIIELVQSLHNDKIELSFTRFGKGGSSAGNYQGTIFEIQKINVVDKDPEFYEHPICFAGNCNQILDVKKFIDNPFLPKSIADELEKFYAKRLHIHEKDKLIGKLIIIATTKHFEPDPFDHHKNLNGIIREYHCFALSNWENLIACSEKLEASIVTYLTKHKVQEVNIRKDFKYI